MYSARRIGALMPGLGASSAPELEATEEKTRHAVKKSAVKTVVILVIGYGVGQEKKSNSWPGPVKPELQ
ncbi:hypothetical protein MTX78_10760 [Hymenobacter tibetensis]|uniref:Uncharacterized protein n=1 Tax=Hymenobacter tibetensis TaxID=497967 RepID=A0ABY4D3Y4_9BACT|nr:hypothetical protein [Hymenobacter tibetensis]UOG77062.1 hypothetical protein MTX78_10760 [Hymenobacter tibetensis]